MKKLLLVSAIASLLLSSAQVLFAESKQQPKETIEHTFVVTSFLSGNNYLHTPENERLFYLMGVIDGIRVSPAFDFSENGEAKGIVDTIDTCTRDMSTTQLDAIVLKYLKDNPELWHRHLNMLIFDAVYFTCTK